MPASTWSTTDKSASITLTGSNLIATAGAVNVGVRGKDPKRTGKYYVEYTSTTTQGATSRFGFANGGTPLTVAAAAASIGTGAQTGTILSYDVFGTQLTNGAVGAAITTGTVLCCAVDLDNLLCWFRVGAAGNWNSQVSYNPATGVGGMPMVLLGLGAACDCYPYAFMASSANSITANFGGSAFTGAVPAGFTSGWDDSVSIVTNVVASQVAVEEWGSGTPAMQVTQAALEEWASVAAAVIVPNTDTRAVIMA